MIHVFGTFVETCFIIIFTLPKFIETDHSRINRVILNFVAWECFLVYSLFLQTTSKSESGNEIEIFCFRLPPGGISRENPFRESTRTFAIAF